MKKMISWVTGLFVWLLPYAAMAEEKLETFEKPVHGAFKFKATIGIAAGLVIAIASLGGAISQSKVATAAMEGISRNPEAASKVMTPMIIALALIESLVIYALVIAFLLQGKI